MALGPSVAAMKAPGQGQGTVPGRVDENEPENNKKAKPLSRRLSTSIGACSTKMTDVLSWDSKLAENKIGLILASIHPTHNPCYHCFNLLHVLT